MTESPANQPAEPADAAETVEVTERDIVFNCPHCSGELVVDNEGAGMTFNCPHCGGRVTVPHVPSAGSMEPAGQPEGEASANEPADAAQHTGAARLPSGKSDARAFDFAGQSDEDITRRVEELRNQLKENQSQTTEMRGHLNRAVIEMNRYQLKLQKLQDRGGEIERELSAAKAHLEGKGNAG